MITGPSQAGGGLQLDGVFLTGDTPQGATVVPGLSLVADSRGFSVIGPQPGVERTLAWSQLEHFSFRHPGTLPDGRPATILEATVDGQALRFLLAVEQVSPGQAAGIESQLNSMISVYGAQATKASSFAMPLDPDAPHPPVMVAAPPHPVHSGGSLPPPAMPLSGNQLRSRPPAPFSMPAGSAVRGQPPSGVGAGAGSFGSLRGGGEGETSAVSAPSPYTGYSTEGGLAGLRH